MVLSEEKIKSIQKKLEGLSDEAKEKKLQEILSGMTEDEVAEISEGRCPFCLIGSGQTVAHKVFENNDVMAILDINPANNGHVILFPKKHFGVLGQIDDFLIRELFSVANKISIGIFEGLKAEGTNIFVANGKVAGQNAPHFLIHIIPRYSDDKILFQWDPKELEEGDKIARKIIEHLPKEKKEEKLTRKKAEIEDYDDFFPGKA
ncbi:MAG: HIT family protein [Candidatus Nanoarchaeia archaeon]|nr:HIT family protein [Candidatus Nanoarchaeia archaeon]